MIFYYVGAEICSFLKEGKNYFDFTNFKFERTDRGMGFGRQPRIREGSMLRKNAWYSKPSLFKILVIAVFTIRED